MSADERGVDVWDFSAAEEDAGDEDYADVVSEVRGDGYGGFVCWEVLDVVVAHVLVRSRTGRKVTSDE